MLEQPSLSDLPSEGGDAPDAVDPAATAAAPRSRKRSSRTRKGSAPPVLVEVVRGQTVESRHRGHIVQVDAAGKIVRSVGAPSTDVMLRSTVKPLGVVEIGRAHV